MLRRVFSIKNRVDVLTLLCQYFESIGYTFMVLCQQGQESSTKERGG